MSINRILSLGLLALTATVGAVQAGVQAKFHLPVEARWGQSILAPGDYKLSLPEYSLGGRQLIVTGGDKNVMIQPTVMDYDRDAIPDADRSYLKLVKVNGTYFVTEYR